jgi:Tol biopolymer transport system component
MKHSFPALFVACLLMLACGDDPTGLDDAPGRLLVTRQPGGNGAEIWSMRPDGSDARQLTSDNRVDGDADWSHDGERIVFTKLNDTTSPVPASAHFEIHVMDADGSDVQKLTTRIDGSDRFPRWSPDGTQIVFSRNSSISTGPRGIFVMNADGSNARALYTGTAFQPDWSPDGSRILFTANDTLHVMNANGSGVAPLGGTAACAGALRAARWSPDGSRIALACDFGGSAIYTMRADGTDVVSVKPLASGTSFITAPIWSPDGRSIAFSHTDGTHDIFIINSTGGNEVRITNDARLDIVTDWQR